MNVIKTGVKTFDQLTDAELDDLIYRGLEQPYAVEERTYRTSKRMIVTQDKMLELAVKLEVQTKTVIRLTWAINVFTVVLVIFTILLFLQELHKIHL